MTHHESTKIRETMEAANAKFTSLFSRGDAAAMAAAYTEGGQVLPPNSDVVTGNQAIQAFWQGLMDTGVKGVQLETVEAEGEGPTAYEVGRFTLSDASGEMIDTGKYVVIWKQQGGQWKLHRDIFNSSRPASGQ
jgi:ketosteroid isomerase-like protein